MSQRWGAPINGVEPEPDCGNVLPMSQERSVTHVSGPDRFGWSGRRDLNPGPLAPQANFINHLQTSPTENKRVIGLRFGPEFGPKCRLDLTRTWNDGNDSRASTTSSTVWNATCFRAHARSYADAVVDSFFESRGEKSACLIYAPAHSGSMFTREAPPLPSVTAPLCRAAH